MPTDDDPPSPGRRRWYALAAGGVAVLVVVVLVAAFVLLRSDGEDPRSDADAAVARFVAAVGAGDPGAGGVTEPPSAVDAEYQAAVAGLGDGLEVEVSAEPAVLDGDGATAALRTEWKVDGATWTTTGTLRLERPDADGPWRARWALAALDDRLEPGDVLDVATVDPDRAAVLDGAGEPLVTPAEVVVIGVQPRRVTDPEGLVATLESVLGIDGAALAARIDAAAPDAFVEVVTLRRSDYDRVRDQVRPLPGTVFREDTQLLTPTRDFARAVLGTVGPATAEQVEASGGRLQAGEVTGQSGVQARYDERLAGAPGLEVTLTRGSAAPTVLERVAAKPGQPVRTTLDVATQTAAEAALADEARVAALVAVRASTSEVIAVANAPAGTPANVALNGHVPPGSTFKVVSTEALLRSGFDPDSTVDCPATVSVDGRPIGNAGGLALGEVPFRTVFARSCNTGFVSLTRDFAPDALTRAAARFGIGVEWDPGLPAATGSVPPTEGPVDQAVTTIGQGRIVVSPLGMAMVAATVAAGRWKAPVLVADPAPVSPAEVPLADGDADALRHLMRAVVTEGTGEALAGVPGGVVAAKTGTAEFGNEDPPRAHAWVVGYQGDVAFAVFVEGGESGSGTAAPIAARFLTELAGG